MEQAYCHLCETTFLTQLELTNHLIEKHTKDEMIKFLSKGMVSDYGY